MTDDPHGYYTTLGVGITAAPDEIKAAYRSLAKLSHPDLHSGQAAAERFKQITEAYEILGDPVKRAEYDTSARAHVESSPNAKREPIAPVKCSVCGKVTAQPRFIIFRQVISYVLLTRATPKLGIFCSDCAAKTAFRASVISAIFGWWGLPWGPIMTVREILRNAFGGERKYEIEEKLNWQNAIAFLDQNKFDLSLSLANKLRQAKSRDIAQAATQLSVMLADQGVKSGTLKSGWPVKPAQSIGQIALGCIVPVLAWTLFFQPASTSSYRPPIRSSIPSTFATSSRPAHEASEKIKILDQCRQRPANGGILFGRQNLTDRGHDLTIRNGTTGDAIVKVRNASTGKVVVSFFASQNQSSTISGIPDGVYRIQFGYGEAMNIACTTFLDARASEFDGVQSMRTEYRADGIYTSVLSFTLYRVAGGNISQENISATNFNSD